MKKAIKIHISGYVFTIDEDAYDKLNDWTQKISEQFKDEEGGAEIVSDIEARVAELFSEKMKDEETVISIEEVNEIISIMGMAEDFSEETTNGNSYETERIKFKKRLYRDDDNAFIGGVCGGLGNYFNVDAVYIRLAFVLLVLFGGFGPLIYLILWIITPKAKTAAQKLEMKGERVNVSNIEKTIKEEFESVRKNIIRQTKSDSYKNVSSGIEKLILLIFKIIKVVFKVILYFIAGMFIFFGAMFLIILLGLLFFGTIPHFASTSGDIFIFGTILEAIPISISGFWAQLGLIIVIGIPLITLIYAGIKIIFNFKTNNKIIGITATTLWFIGLFLSLSIGLNIAGNYKNDNQEIKSFNIDKTNSDTLYLESKIISEEYDEDSQMDLDNYLITKEKGKLKITGHPDFRIEQSYDKSTSLKLKYKSKGKSRRNALNNITQIEYNWSQKDSLITFDDIFKIKGEQKIYGQEVEMILYLPVGKSVYLSPSMEEIIFDIQNVQNMWDNNMTDKIWTMTKDGLSLYPNEKPEKDTESYDIDLD